MAALFGAKPAGLRTKYSGMRTTASVFGIPIPLIYGKQRIAGKVIWYGDFQANKAKSSGKKGGGGGKGMGKSPGSWVYTTAVEVLLCQGNVQGIESVWESVGKFVTASSSEPFTVPGGGGTYTPTNAAQFSNDAGVGYDTAYSIVALDYGAPGAVTFTGTNTSPFVKVTGTPLAGQYKVDPVTGVYTFASADAGKVLTISYSFYSFQTIQTELTIIPFSAPYTYTVEHQPYFGGDKGVYYYPSGTLLKAGLGGAGTYDANGGSYVFAGGSDAGKAVVVTYQYNQVNSDQNAPSQLNMTFFSGARGQAAWSYMTSKHPGSDLGYSDVCYMGSSGLYLGYSPTMPNYNYEIIGLYPAGAGIQDANPADVIESILTDTGFGAGFAKQNLSYTLQSPARSYWAANNFFISMVLEQQNSAGAVIGEILEASRVGAFWSEGLLKFVPNSSVTAVANGYVYNPKTSPVVSLNDNDYVPGKGEEPIKVSRTAWEDAYNKVGVRWTVRTNSYNEDVLEAEDPASIDTFGLRREPPVSYPFICTEKAAQLAANLRVQAGNTVRNTYSFNLRSNYAYLEPMDIVLLTDANLGLSNTPVRLLSITDAPDKPLAVTAKDFPWATGDAVLYPKQAQKPSDDLSRGQQDPGATDIFVFEAPATLSKQEGNSLYIFVGGKELAWGGCSLWISFDNITYNLLTTTSVSGRFGTLTSPFYSGPDPDLTQDLFVTLENSTTTLSSVTQADADHFVTRSILAAPNIVNPTYYESPAAKGYNITGPTLAPITGAWSNPTNFSATRASGNFAEITLGNAPDRTTSGWGQAAGFGFSIPAGNVLLGYQIFFDAKLDQSPAIAFDSVALSIQMIPPGVSSPVVGTAKLVQLTSPFTTYQEYSVGGPRSQVSEWGTNFNLTDINKPSNALASDKFLRSTFGVNWSVAFGAMILNPAFGFSGNSAGQNCSFYNSVAWPNDQWAQVTITLYNTGVNGVGVALRANSSSSGNAYIFYLFQNLNQWVLRKVVNGATSNLDSGNFTFAIGDTLYLEVQGTTLIARINGNTVSTKTDSSLATGSAGISSYFNDQTVYGSSWQGGDFTTDNDTMGPTFQAISAGTLPSPFVVDVRNARMRVFVGTGQATPEIIGYKTAALVGDHIYKLSYLRRGIENTKAQNWPKGSFFGRLDQASYVYQYPASYIGKTAYIKATSFNIFGNMAQSITQVSAVVVPLIGVSGAYDIGSGALLTNAGSVPPTWYGPFTYTSNTTSITWTWDIYVVRNDGSTQHFVGTQTTSGLTSNTTYYFYPYLDDANGLTKTVLTFLGGGHGTPTWAFTASERSNANAALASAYQHVGLAAAPMAAATTASGGGGGGGGGGGCFTGNVKVRTLDFGIVRFDALPTDRDFLIENECGIFFARLLVHENHTSEMLDMGRGELVTLNHLLKAGEKWVCAEHYFSNVSQRTVCTTVYNLQVLTRDEEARHYILENGIVAHNSKMV